MDNVVENPLELGLPHPKWRPSQYNAYSNAKRIYENGGGSVVIEAPTGIGKSGIPTALGATDNVTVLVHNHGLLKQYEAVYNFDIIMGRQEYPCILESKVEEWKTSFGLVPTAADCHFTSADMCPVGHRCPYVVARNKALSSNRMACTYKYAALSEAIHDRAGILCFDEAHDCYEELLEFSKFELDDRTAQDYKLPKFPLVGFGQNGEGDLLEGESREIMKRWFAQALGKVGITDLFSVMTPDGAKNKRMFERLMSGLNLLTSDQILFYRCSKPGEHDDWRFDSRSTPTKMLMQIRSLDVKDLVKSLTENKTLNIYMSATIGNPKPLMGELGIDNFSHFSYDHPVPVQARPVYDLGLPPMTKKNLDNSPNLYKLQADKIASFIQSFDPRWRGIVLTSSNYKINLLRRFLKESLNGRVMIPNENGLSAQIKQFTESKKPGELAVATMQGWGSGLSLEGDIARIAIVAGIPYANPGDRFDQLRMSTDTGKAYAFWNAYCAVVQATGRVSRGEKDANGNYVLNVAALADGGCTSPLARHNYSKWFKDAIQPWQSL